jgi:hypothetical protein
VAAALRAGRASGGHGLGMTVENLHNPEKCGGRGICLTCSIRKYLEVPLTYTNGDGEKVVIGTANVYDDGSGVAAIMSHNPIPGLETGQVIKFRYQ